MPYKFKFPLESTYDAQEMSYGSPELNNDSITILNYTDSEFIIQYTAVHHMNDIPDSNINDDLYFNEVYSYTEKAVKTNGVWNLTGVINNPVYLSNESTESWYSTYTN
jgi:hypothetical protein